VAAAKKAHQSIYCGNVPGFCYQFGLFCCFVCSLLNSCSQDFEACGSKLSLIPLPKIAVDRTPLLSTRLYSVSIHSFRLQYCTQSGSTNISRYVHSSTLLSSMLPSSTLLLPTCTLTSPYQPQPPYFLNHLCLLRSRICI
jgi:hypothetical protein